MAQDMEELSRLSRPSSTPLRYEPGHEWMTRALRARRSQLTPANAVGLGLGTKRTGKRDTGQAAAVVYVPEKMSPSRLARGHIASAPTSLQYGGKELPVDVQEIGPLRLQSRPGDSLGPEERLATLGAFARDAQGLVAITAMHVTGMSEFPAGSGQGLAIFSPSPLKGSERTLLGNLLQGTRTEVDAAKLSVANPLLAEVPADVKGVRYLVYPGDQGTSVKLQGATSGAITGLIQNVYAEFYREGLSACFVMTMDTHDGDSGAAILDWNGLLLGFHVGRITIDKTDFAVASPATLVLHKLGCTLP
jgi:hypothetical protein